jgi:TolB-like protein/class 3 adenylate cyclase/Tfp pilus assembly protein PilF
MGEPRSDFELAHVLFMDVVGYSKLLIDDQRELIAELNAVVRATDAVRTAEAAGKLIRLPTGDGMALAFFTTPEAPVRCAVEIDRVLRQRAELKNLRMGIHTGPVSTMADVNERSNVAGAGINMAQRVMDCGDAGHILLSSRVAEDLAHFRDWSTQLHDLGECEVKHGLRVRVFNLYGEGFGNPSPPAAVTRQEQSGAVQAATTRRSRRTKLAVAIGLGAVMAGIIALALLLRDGSARFATADKSIAVLPFVDLSAAKDQEYFCDGMSEEILDSLAKTEGLRVVARTSSFSFKGKSADVSEIGQKLGVATILEGSLRREGNRIRITAQLINARDGFHLWSDTFERELKGVFAVQDEITRKIVDALKVKLAVAPPARGQQNTEAYDLYLQGLYYSRKSDEESLRKALGLFEGALDKDPQFARAWTGIASVWNWLADSYMKPLEAYPAAKAAASKALALDPRDAEAHVWLGEAERVLGWDYAGERAQLEQALKIDPNSATAHVFLALLLGAEGGNTALALEHVELGRKADPLSAIVSNFAGIILLSSGKIEEAIAEGKRTLELDPDFSYFESALGAAYREQGRLTDALAVYEKAGEVSKQPMPGLAVTYAMAGRTTETRQLLDHFLEQARTSYFAGDAIAQVYVALGEPDEAFRWLDRAAVEHSAPLTGVAFRPEFRSLHSDPRFIDLLRRINLDPEKALAPSRSPDGGK